MRTGQRMEFRIGMKKDNKGYSLIELLIVIAIIVVICSVMAFSSSIVTRARQRNVVKRIAQAVGQTRISTMSKDDTYLEIWKDTDGIYLCQVVDNTPLEKKKIGPSSLTVEIDNNDDGAFDAELDSTHLKCEFNRASGVVNTTDFYRVGCGQYTMILYKVTGKCTWG